MRLISKFRDYYDNQQKFDDPNDGLFIIRNTSEPEYFNDLRQGNKVSYGVIGFAGSLYPFVEFPSDKVISYDADSFMERYKFDRYTQQKIEKHFQRFSEDKEKLFESYGPIFAIYSIGCSQWIDYVRYESYIVKNPNLTKYGFNKILYPHIAWNNLKNYVMNQARPLKPIPEMDDVTKAEIHGFNKFSFRKDPKGK